MKSIYNEHRKYVYCISKYCQVERKKLVWPMQSHVYSVLSTRLDFIIIIILLLLIIMGITTTMGRHPKNVSGFSNMTDKITILVDHSPLQEKCQVILHVPPELCCQGQLILTFRTYDVRKTNQFVTHQYHMKWKWQGYVPRRASWSLASVIVSVKLCSHDTWALTIPLLNIINNTNKES